MNKCRTCWYWIGGKCSRSTCILVEDSGDEISKMISFQHFQNIKQTVLFGVEYNMMRMSLLTMV